MDFQRTLLNDSTPPGEAPGPVVLPIFEYNLLKLARFLVGEASRDAISKLILTKISTPPPCVSRDCVRLAQQIISQGVMLYLVRAGGWRHERFLRNNQPVLGRIWERIPLPQRLLTFSDGPMAFLMWLTAERPTDPATKVPPNIAAKTPADEVFFMLALDALRPLTEVYPAVSSARPFAANSLCWLTHAAGVIRADHNSPIDFSQSFQGTALAILECLQHDLTRRWIRNEREKNLQASWPAMQQQGQAEEQVLTAYLKAVDQANRWDLARFVLNANSTIILNQTQPMPSFWLGNLRNNQPPRLADRLQIQRLGLVFPRQMETLRSWNQRSKSVGHFDDDYAAKQLWKTDWEAAQGDRVAALAQKVLERIEPLRTG